MKSLILLSGGVDSTTCLALSLSRGEEVKAFSFDYGQKQSNGEKKALLLICNHYGIEHHRINLGNIFFNSHSSLVNDEIKITKGEYKDQANINTEVEFRNGVFLSIMTSIAMQENAEKIYYGAHKDDSGAIYPDCSKEFFNAFSESIKIGTRGKVSIEAPFLNSTKADIVRLGKGLLVPYEYTYSCYEGGEKHCGECGTCIDRKKAFKANGIKFN